VDELLHERLRDIAECNMIGGCVKTLFGETDCPDQACSVCVKRAAKTIADEIEKYYIPRPRFEDGEPIQFGDDIEIYNRTGLLDSGTIQSFHPNNGSVWMLSLVGVNHERLVRFDPGTCVIKRPEHKVLDVDGVETKAGDTVYTKSGIKYTVEKIGTQQCDGMEDWDGTPWIMFDNGSWMHAHDVTHRIPDSLEKLRDDLRDLIPFMHDDEFTVNASDLIGITNRLTAIMELDA
jgi:hypothetical protein